MVLVKELHEECIEILNTKGLDYTQADERLADFKDDAEDLGITSRQAWGTKFLKQVRALITWARGNELKSESVRSRALDVMNYASFAVALEIDEKKEPNELIMRGTTSEEREREDLIREENP